MAENKKVFEKDFFIKLFTDKSWGISKVQAMIIKKLSQKPNNDTNSEEFDKILNDNNIDIHLLALELLPYGDPTYDTTFKSIFGDEKNKEILICLLNSLLNFTGEKQIKELTIKSEKLDTSKHTHEKGKSNVHGAVDVLCNTESGQKIAIEMQRAKQPYFLARTQHYMGKLIANQINESEGNDYHNKLLDTYILIIAKENLFTGEHKLGDNKIYEIDVKPMVTQLNQEFPGNKIHWKYFELSKFKKHNDYKNITKNSDLKLQFLEFLTDCGTQLYEPDRHDIIKKAYNLIKNSKMDSDEQLLSWIRQANEADYERANKLATKKAEMEAEKRGEKKGEEKGEKKGEKIGKLKCEIELIKTLLRKHTEKEEINSWVTFLNRKHYGAKFDESIDHISKNMDKKAIEICEDLDLINIELNDDNSSI